MESRKSLGCKVRAFPKQCCCRQEQADTEDGPWWTCLPVSHADCCKQKILVVTLLSPTYPRKPWLSQLLDNNLWKEKRQWPNQLPQKFGSQPLSHTKPLETRVIHSRIFPTDLPLTPPPCLHICLTECSWQILFCFILLWAKKFPCSPAPGKSWTDSAWHFVI